MARVHGKGSGTPYLGVIPGYAVVRPMGGVLEHRAVGVAPRHAVVQTPDRFWSTILWGDVLGCSRSNLGYHAVRALCFGSLPCSNGVMSRWTGRMLGVSLGIGESRL